MIHFFKDTHSTQPHEFNDEKKLEQEETYQEIMEKLLNAFESNKNLINKLTRTYNVYKSEYFTDFGINIQNQKTMSPSTSILVFPSINVDSRSPAKKAGMQNNQRIVAINGKYVNKELNCLNDVCEALERSNNSKESIELIVISSQLWESFIENPKILNSLTYKELPIKKSNKRKLLKKT